MNGYATLDDLPERFWAKVDKTDECWLWTGANVRGYGQFSIARELIYTHRLTWSIANGVDLPKRWMQIDHLCKVVSCCNPAHLELVTARENALRSDGAAAINARKTHCLNEHPLNEWSTYVTKRGSRQCRICRSARLRAWRERNKAAA